MENSKKVMGLQQVRQSLVERGHATEDLWVSALDAVIADLAAEELVSVTLPRKTWTGIAESIFAIRQVSQDANHSLVLVLQGLEKVIEKQLKISENSLDTAADIG